MRVSKKRDCSLHTKIIRLQFILNENSYICYVPCARKLHKHLVGLVDSFVLISFLNGCKICLFSSRTCNLYLNLVAPVKNSLWCNNFHKLRIGSLHLTCVAKRHADFLLCSFFQSFKTTCFHPLSVLFANFIQFN